MKDFRKIGIAGPALSEQVGLLVFQLKAFAITNEFRISFQSHTALNMKTADIITAPIGKNAGTN
jgi:hypothetical protein